ncbi:Na-translocating system protein MpsB [Vibrio hannami]|nr:putative inorganic carbon transporter subunit DabA [Vibrio hannami]MDG3086572.1 Na-translocating system protein MpsB [Vibrio hannami]
MVLETFGTAGFFNLAIETCELAAANTATARCRSFLNRSIESKKRRKNPVFNRIKNIKKRQFRSAPPLKMMKQNLLAELAASRSKRPWLSSANGRAQPDPPRSRASFPESAKGMAEEALQAKLSLDRMETPDAGIPVGFTEEEKAAYARQALQMMGITDRFAPLVVICGHGSRSTNNPYASALDCGACGGASGAFQCTRPCRFMQPSERQTEAPASTASLFRMIRYSLPQSTSQHWMNCSGSMYLNSRLKLNKRLTGSTRRSPMSAVLSGPNA